MANKSTGVTATERLLADFCERSFLKLWSYPNPYKDALGYVGQQPVDHRLRGPDSLGDALLGCRRRFKSEPPSVGADGLARSWSSGHGGSTLAPRHAQGRQGEQG